jgi:hypothetical protein
LICIGKTHQKTRLGKPINSGSQNQWGHLTVISDKFISIVKEQIPKKDSIQNKLTA